MREFVAKHLKYPADALKQKKEGTVLVRFKVTADGNVENVKIEKGVFPSLDKEALRICSLLPAFKPAVAGGKPESSVFVMPVEFRLPQEKTDAAPVRKKETKAPRADDGVPKEGGESKPGATSVQPQDVPDNAPVIAV